MNTYTSRMILDLLAKTQWSQERLADELTDWIGDEIYAVSQPMVSRWATGKAQPDYPVRKAILRFCKSILASEDSAGPDPRLEKQPDVDVTNRILDMLAKTRWSQQRLADELVNSFGRDTCAISQQMVSRWAAGKAQPSYRAQKAIQRLIQTFASKYGDKGPRRP